MEPTPAKDLAQTIMAEIGPDFSMPDVDLSSAVYQLPDMSGPLSAVITKLELSSFTTGQVSGSGAFDQVMKSIKAHMIEQFDKGRISSDQFAKVYIELTTAAMATALQFLLGSEKTHWEAVAAQAMARRAIIEATTAAVGLETAKAQLAAARSQADILEAQYVLTVMQVATEDAKYKLTHMQEHLIEEQYEAQRGQTMNTRSDGTTLVAGMLGKQKELYDQQIDSYQKDAQYKAAKMYLDAWITQKTLDEGLTAPTELTNATINTVLTTIRTSNGLV